ncbi:unnamed protein product [Triticum turgidum subsp. durum]|uniref:Uncharacterized protein n=1 Tax=Triticum turgidum subsp. durum TaxID=4567 RepID=A0A9R1RV63_TRITD|nr:unnamed protein product [Triticum turgidum subsp. durum]
MGYLKGQYRVVTNLKKERHDEGKNHSWSSRPGAVQGGGGRAGAGRDRGHWRSSSLVPHCEEAGQPPWRPLRRSCREAAARWSGARLAAGEEGVGVVVTKGSEAPARLG